jgi:hypothetical protein
MIVTFLIRSLIENRRQRPVNCFILKLRPCVDHAFSVSAKRYWCKKYGANTRLILPTPLQQAFANKQIVCVEYDSLAEEQEREIFQVCPDNAIFSFSLSPTHDFSVSNWAWR